MVLSKATKADADQRQLSSPLRRIVRILDSVLPSANSLPNGLTFWSRALNTERQLTSQTTTETARALVIFRDETERAYVGMARTQLDVNDYDASFAALRAASEFTLFSANGNQIVGHLSPPVMGVLRLCSKVEQPTDYLLPDAEFTAVREAVERLEKLLARLPEDDALVIVLGEQIAQMKRALIDYQIGGEYILRRAVYAFDGAVVNQFSGERESPAKEEIFEAARHVTQTAKRLLLATGIVAAGLLGAQEIGQVLAETTEFYVAGYLPPAATTDLPTR
jgi:hypothetical protein